MRLVFNLNVMKKKPPEKLAQTLDLCVPGTDGTIVSLEGAPTLKQRLLELGFVPGTRVSVIKLATLGDPLQVRVRGYDLGLRKREARAITVTVNHGR